MTHWRNDMSRTKKTTTRGRKQDRERVAGKQEHEVKHVARKTKKPGSTVRKVIAEVGNMRKRVIEKLTGK